MVICGIISKEVIMEYVYIVKNPTISGMVKIGRTKNLKKRLCELNQILPIPWELIKYYEVQNSAYIEDFIHKTLEHIRVNKNREFFKSDNVNIVKLVDDTVEIALSNYRQRKYKSIVDITSNSSIGVIIKNVRKSKKLNQTQLGKICEMSINGISNIEKGQSDPSLSTLMKILDALDCNIQIGLSVDLNNSKNNHD